MGHFHVSFQLQSYPWAIVLPLKMKLKGPSSLAQVLYYVMKKKIVAHQYAPRHWYGQLSIPVSKKQRKREPRVPGEPPMLKSVYLLEK